MASTNKTAHYDLSQYSANDKPTYLVDYNTDMSNIDTGIATAQTKADTAYTTADTAIANASNAQTTADTAVTNASIAQTTANENKTNIGTMTDLSTSVKTDLVNAINEVNTKASNVVVNTLEGSETDKAPSVNAVNVELTDIKSKIISESGTDYIKYTDGTMICFGVASGTTTLSDWYSFCKRTADITINFSQTFTSAPTVVATPRETTAFGIMNGGVTTSTAKFLIFKPSSITETSYKISYVAIGKWQ